MSLSELAIKNAKPNTKSYWMKDDNGLYLEIHPTGKKVWRLRYWISGKEGKVKLGEYRDVFLAFKGARNLMCNV